MKKTFDELTNAIATHRAMMAKILTEHAERKQRNLDFFGPGDSKVLNAQLCKFTRARIIKSDKILAGEIKRALRVMRTELDRLAREPADSDLIDNLRMMQEFDVRMTPDDLKAYVKAANGNLAALFCIDALAHQCGCRLSGRAIGDFQQAINELEALSSTPMLIAPEECLKAALEVYSRDATKADINANTERMDVFAAERIPQLIEVWVSKTEPAVIFDH